MARTAINVGTTANDGTGDTLRAAMIALNAMTAELYSGQIGATAFTVGSANVNAQTGTTYTLQASDNGKVVTLSNAAAITVTVPSGLGVGFSVVLIQIGAGQVTCSPSSTTLRNRQSHTKTAGQYAAVSLYCYATDVLLLQGDSAA